MTHQEFRVGDLVNWLGAEGVVKAVGGALVIELTSGDNYTFYTDGRYLRSQEPSLKLVSRKKTVRRMLAYEIEATDMISFRVIRHYDDNTCINNIAAKRVPSLDYEVEE